MKKFVFTVSVFALTMASAASFAGSSYQAKKMGQVQFNNNKEEAEQDVSAVADTMDEQNPAEIEPAAGADVDTATSASEEKMPSLADDMKLPRK